ncbi:MAG: molecular chaperone DnaJ [Erythrobacter sp.]|uniref:molecular chaperone DnaJ n=1 Tax=Erythrobacter sp. TaxID=1042 RepID=UPI0032EAA652
MIKAAIILVLAIIVWRWALGSWPWDGLFEASGREADLARARQLLGVGKRAGRDQIVAAHKRMLARVHPDRGGSSGAVHEANAARDLLLAELSGGNDAGDAGAGSDGAADGD